MCLTRLKGQRSQFVTFDVVVLGLKVKLQTFYVLNEFHIAPERHEHLCFPLESGVSPANSKKESRCRN